MLFALGCCSCQPGLSKFLKKSKSKLGFEKLYKILVECRNALNLSVSKFRNQSFYSNFKWDCSKMSFIFFIVWSVWKWSFLYKILDALHTITEKNWKIKISKKKYWLATHLATLSWTILTWLCSELLHSHSPCKVPVPQHSTMEHWDFASGEKFKGPSSEVFLV